MMNSVLEGLKKRRLDDMHLEIWLTTERSCAIEEEKGIREKDMNGCHPHRDGDQQKRTVVVAICVSVYLCLLHNHVTYRE